MPGGPRASPKVQKKTDQSMELRASWFSENSDRGIAISVSILSSGFSDALFVCFW